MSLHNCFPTWRRGSVPGHLTTDSSEGWIDRWCYTAGTGTMSRRRCGHTLWGLSGRPVCVERYHHYYRGLLDRDIACRFGVDVPVQGEKHGFRYKPRS